MPVTNTDAVLWYNVGEFGKAGYAVPNWSNDVGSLNPQILDWTYLVGRNLFHIMHHEDADLRIPPSINTAKRIHKLYIRAGEHPGRAGRAAGREQHGSDPRPAGGRSVPRVSRCRSSWCAIQFMRRWAELILMSLAEAMQHTENRKSLEISTAFAGQVGQYIRRVYINMAIELFGKTREQATADGFALTDADFAAYNPGDFFTQTEMVDTVPRLDRVFTEDRLELLAEGIAVTELPELRPWPTNLTLYYAGTRSDATIGGGGERQRRWNVRRLGPDHSAAAGTVR